MAAELVEKHRLRRRIVELMLLFLEPDTVEDRQDPTPPPDSYDNGIYSIGRNFQMDVCVLYFQKRMKIRRQSRPHRWWRHLRHRQRGRRKEQSWIGRRQRKSRKTELHDREGRARKKRKKEAEKESDIGDEPTRTPPPSLALPPVHSFIYQFGRKYCIFYSLVFRKWQRFGSTNERQI